MDDLRLGFIGGWELGAGSWELEQPPHKIATQKGRDSKEARRLLTNPASACMRGLFFIGFCIPGIKAKPSGLPDSNVIFFVATKKTKQKKAWRGAWHVVLEVFLVASKVV